MKVSELTGAELDYWVAKAGEEWKRAHQHFPTMTLGSTFKGVELRDFPRGEFGTSVLTCVLIPNNPFRQDPKPFCPSIWWEQGGPIIDRERIGTYWTDEGIDEMAWGAEHYESGHQEYGPTPLIAAMRAYIASVYGEEVPDAKTE